MTRANKLFGEADFPIVFQSECVGFETGVIDRSPFTLASTMEAVELQSYMDSQWQAYQETNPNDEDLPV